MSAFKAARFSTIICVGVFSAAEARADCTTFNGTQSAISSGVILYSPTVGFDPGDVLTVSATVTNNQSSNGVYTLNVNVAAASKNQTQTVSPGATLSFGPLSLPVISSAETVYAYIATSTPTSVGDLQLTLTCTPAAVPNTDSDKLSALQANATHASAQTSANAFQSILGDAIGGAFSGLSSTPEQMASSGSPSLPGQMSLGYSERSRVPTPFNTSPIRLWSNARISGADDEEQSQDYSFVQFNGAIGADYKLTRNLVVGVIGGYEDFRFKLDDVGKLDGDGLSIGGYVGWHLAPSLRLEGGISRSFLNYDANAGTASGEFDGDRWIYTAGLTGNLSFGKFVVEPGSSVVWLNEEQDSYTDTLGTLHGARSFTEGRVATGAKVSYPAEFNHLLMRPYAGLYADYYFSDDDAQLRTVPTFGISDGWSARAIAGAEFSASRDSPWSMTFGGELGNIGSGDGLIPTGRAGASLRY